MAICAILGQKVDSRKDGDDCLFNGYLEDYLSLRENEIDDDLKESFEKVLEVEPDTKICVDLHCAVNIEAISNQIIRYKDICKLNGKPLVIPYILYFQHDDEHRAIIICDCKQYGYIYAKGLYYCMTEPAGEFIDCKNEIVAISSNQETILKVLNQLFTVKAGSIQRNIDHELFHNYEELKTASKEAANALKLEAMKKLPELEDRTNAIYHYVTNWFLLKKVLYVQYMVNKNILSSIHENNIKKQRNQAKLNSEEIDILSFSEMWRLPKQEPIA